MSGRPDPDDETRRKRQRLTQAKYALTAAVWYVDRAVPTREAEGFKAVAEQLMDRIRRWGDEEAGESAPEGEER